MWEGAGHAAFDIDRSIPEMRDRERRDIVAGRQEAFCLPGPCACRFFCCTPCQFSPRSYCHCCCCHHSQPLPGPANAMPTKAMPLPSQFKCLQCLGPSLTMLPQVPSCWAQQWAKQWGNGQRHTSQSNQLMFDAGWGSCKSCRLWAKLPKAMRCFAGTGQGQSPILR